MSLFWNKLFILAFIAHYSFAFSQVVGLDKAGLLNDLTEEASKNGRFSVVYHGKTLVKGMYLNNQRSGNWVSYFLNGQQKLKGTYLEGKKHGEWTFWNKGGEVIAKFSYNKGLPVGHWKGFYEGHRKAIDLVYFSNGKLLQCIQYYTSGIIALNFEYSYEKDLTKTEYSYYFENFHLFQYEQLTNGVNNGLYHRYHENGVLWESYHFVNGTLTKVGEMRTTGGLPKENADFRNGSGIITRYYANGLVYSKSTYKNGRKNGQFKLFDQGKSLVGVGYYNNNIATGHWDVYSKYHNLIEQLDFDTIPGQVYVIRKTSPANKEREEGAYLHGFRHGRWLSYNAYGELVSSLNYRYGFLNGEQVHYNGRSVSRRYNYSNGNKSGKFIFFNIFGEILSEEQFVCESRVDSNWYESPQTGWVRVVNIVPKSNMIRMFFYPPLPGMALHKTYMAYQDQDEFLFPVQRNIRYKYWPRLKPPKFVGNQYAEKEFIQKHTIIPDSLRTKQVEGSVLLRYKVDEFGLISDISLLKTIGLGLDKIAIDVVESFPPLHPASFNGLPIECYVVREIDFKF